MLLLPLAVQLGFRVTAMNGKRFGDGSSRIEDRCLIGAHGRTFSGNAWPSQSISEPRYDWLSEFFRQPRLGNLSIDGLQANFNEIVRI
jgi:hypothetical protein